MKEYRISHLVISEHLNHHGTLFAGRIAEWMVEAAFIASAGAVGRPDDVVCLTIHSMTFTTPVQRGDILTLCARIVKAGTSSLMVHVRAVQEIGGVQPAEGFLTFVCLDPDTNRPRPHGVVLDAPADDAEQEARARAAAITAG